jgi:hypothetical protein
MHSIPRRRACAILRRPWRRTSPRAGPPRCGLHPRCDALAVRSWSGSRRDAMRGNALRRNRNQGGRIPRHQTTASIDVVFGAAQNNGRHQALTSADDKLVKLLRKSLPKALRLPYPVRRPPSRIGRNDAHKVSPWPVALPGMCAQAHMNSRRGETPSHKGGIVAQIVEIAGTPQPVDRAPAAVPLWNSTYGALIRKTSIPSGFHMAHASRLRPQSEPW